jgi:hypothetical protein
MRSKSCDSSPQLDSFDKSAHHRVFTFLKFRSAAGMVLIFRRRIEMFLYELALKIIMRDAG